MKATVRHSRQQTVKRCIDNLEFLVDREDEDNERPFDDLLFEAIDLLREWVYYHDAEG